MHAYRTVFNGCLQQTTLLSVVGRKHGLTLDLENGYMVDLESWWHRQSRAWLSMVTMWMGDHYVLGFVTMWMGDHYALGFVTMWMGDHYALGFVTMWMGDHTR